MNPFLALIGVYEKKEKTEKSSQKENQTKEKKEKYPKGHKPIKKDTWIEAELIRPLVAKKADETAFNLFNTYKKAHGMVSYI